MVLPFQIRHLASLTMFVYSCKFKGFKRSFVCIPVKVLISSLVAYFGGVSIASRRHLHVGGYLGVLGLLTMLRKACMSDINHNLNLYLPYRTKKGAYETCFLAAQKNIYVQQDGREVQLSHLYPCFLGSRMLGSTAFPWFSGAASPLHDEDHSHLIAAFAVAGLVLSIIAYDYQDIGVLVVLFCIFHACIGLISPSLARLRTMHVPNELRGGMISASLVPANAAYFFVLIIGGYYRCLSNAAIMAFAAVGLLSAACCIHALRWWRKHPRQNWHKL